MRMMSHPGSVVKQFIHSTSEILLDKGVKVLNCQFPFCSWMVSYPGHGTRIARGFVRYKGYQLLLIRSISEFLNPVPQEILVMAPELQEDLLGTKVKKVLLVFTYIVLIYTSIWCHKRCHGTRIARGMGTIIISVSLCLYLVSPLVPQEMSQHQRLQEVSLYQFI